MDKDISSADVGDKKSPSMRQSAAMFEISANAELPIQAVSALKKTIVKKLENFSKSQKHTIERQSSIGSCEQELWFSFFFDGTGNNMEADIKKLKHSNVAKLYRVHQDDDSVSGIYRFYIPGVGTYFKDVNDSGGTKLGLASADKGDDRLNWAFRQFELKMGNHIARAVNKTNAIKEVNFSVFGFSRGSALARAFVNKLINDRCKKDQDNVWRLVKGGCRIRIRFMGLFDTVASVGIPMSTNNTSIAGIATSLSTMLSIRVTGTNYMNTWPQRLAFANQGQAGADPSPGNWNGHSSWGDEMRIPDMVESVQHFVAAHEIRNSFPLDSITVREGRNFIKPDKFLERVYPGVHSDVGGSYRPGEGGRCEEPNKKLGLIPLRHMYDFAIDEKVPLLPVTSWQKFNEEDFDIHSDLLKSYEYYISKIPPMKILGGFFNKHMGLYFSWRFRSIRLKQKGNHAEELRISKNNAIFKKEKDELDSIIRTLEKNSQVAMERVDFAKGKLKEINSYNVNERVKYGKEIARCKEDIVIAELQQREVQDKLLKAKAKLQAVPKESKLQEAINTYDAQLLSDVEKIYRHCMESKNEKYNGVTLKRENLRPHYKELIVAYENEYVLNKGLSDSGIIDFFDNYVHDSLAGFAGDATLPSDPRVIYLGGSFKYRYANNKNLPEEDLGGVIA